ncbi:hypothetical protein OF83DRAFT_1071175 [Amylostereum chailletii]|nr:hypothetical protein OF83DRAFT_1071175 [Amylostereum chailletii]
MARISETAALHSATGGISGAADIWDRLLSNIQIFASLVESFGEIHPYAKMASSVLLAAVKPLLSQDERDKSVQKLLETMNDVYSHVKASENLNDIDDTRKFVLQCMSRQTVECAYFIRDYSKVKRFWIRAGKNIVSGADDRIEKYTATFIDLKRVFTERGVLKTEMAVFRVLESLDDIGANVELMNLTRARGAGMNTSKRCLPGTRVQTLDRLSDWVNHASSTRVCFLVGGAGTGKSAIAHAIGHRFHALGRLGSFFCFDRNFQGDRHPESALSAIAWNLAHWDSGFKRALANIIQEDAWLVDAPGIGSQWEHLIVKPAQRLTIAGPVLIVIDALDESGHSNSRRRLLSLLTRNVVNLPSNFRILVTSRPESDVIKSTLQNDFVHFVNLEEQGTEAREDIAVYIRERFSGDSLETGRLDDADYLVLTEKSEGLFQWAFTACETLLPPTGGLTVKERFRRLLRAIDHRGLQSIDALYSGILQQAFDPNDDDVMSRFRSVMAQVFSASEPLSSDSLHGIRRYWNGSDMDEVNLIVRRMGALLGGVADRDTPIRPFHSSFRDFLTEKERSGVWHIERRDGDHIMAFGSIGVMNTRLRFNICHLGSSYVRNKDIPDLTDRLNKAVPPVLRYAVRYWQAHLTLITDLSDFWNILRDFLYNKLLFWLELLSLMQEVYRAGRALHIVAQLLDNDQIPDALPFVIDAARFIRRFGGMISQSAPHIYHSAIPFAPPTSVFRTHYASKLQHVPSIKNLSSKWPLLQNVLRGHNDGICSVAYSPDGTRIVSGSDDWTIRIWDAETGQPVGKPLQGHTSEVNSAAYSPDGTRIVSGSYDKAVRIWCAETGQAIGDPLQCHTSAVFCVAYSPDGTRIISSSRDATICIWNAETGKLVGEPLQGHTQAIFSVAYSPDGTHVVSGSRNNVVCFWDAGTGKAMGGPLRGHSSPVYSVAYSPDGTCVVSGSGDFTVRIWDAQAREAIGDPLQGHTSTVNSVAYSPDGTRIVSCSYDKLIRVWDAKTGQAVGKILQGHTSWVSSVAFSPDGTRIVSGSNDKTIRVWDSETGDAVEGLLQGHASWVCSAVYSTDGTRIVSASYDKTIRVWDAETGQAVGDPLEGHVSTVLSVSVSSDGTRIISGSSDKTVRIWDAQTGRVIGEPLRGHTSTVYSVSCSPDGTSIASGSYDKTVRIWDVMTDYRIGRPLRGHTSTVYSVTYAPNSRHIASGSCDKTIRIWNVETGQTTCGPLRGHTGAVSSVAYSPDGTRIVSGSRDTMIRIWDAETGQAVGRPLRGHASEVNSVAYSPDGTHIVSGSDDWTIRIWNAETGHTVGGPFQGHTSWVCSVAFSPDGRQIVSTSSDATVRVWDVNERRASESSGTGGLVLPRLCLRILTCRFSRSATTLPLGQRAWRAGYAEDSFQPYLYDG